MNSQLKSAAFVGLVCALACTSRGQTQQWSTPVPTTTADGKLFLGGNEIWITSAEYTLAPTATLYQATESGSLNGSITLSAAALGANEVQVIDATADSSGNAYVLLECAVGGSVPNNFTVVKVNTNLVQVWATQFVTGTAIPRNLQLGSSSNPFVSAYYANYAETFSFASDGTLNAGQPFQFNIPQGASINSLAVIYANGAYPDEPYVGGISPSDPAFSPPATGTFIASPSFASSLLWTPSVGWTGSGTSNYTSGNLIWSLTSDNKYVYAAATAAFEFSGSSEYEEPIWLFCGSDGNFPTSGIWNRSFIGTNYTLTPGTTDPLYSIVPSQVVVDNEHDLLIGGGFTAMNGTSQNTGMLIACESDITGIGKSLQVIRSDSVGLASYPTGGALVGASASKGVAWALSGLGSNALFKITDNATTFAFLGATSPPTTPNQYNQLEYFGLAVNPSTGEAYVLGNGYLSDYK